MNICMLVTTSITNDPRVMKEGIALADAGNQVKVIGVRRAGMEPFEESVAGMQLVRLDLIHMRFVRWLKKRRGLSPTQSALINTVNDVKRGRARDRYTRWIISGLYQVQDILHLLIVTISLLMAGIRENQDIFHAHDVDTLLPAVLLGSFRKKPVIYDAHEYWYGQEGRFISNNLMKLIEKICIRRCFDVITVNDTIANLMKKNHSIRIPKVILNVPERTQSILPVSVSTTDIIELLYHGFYQERRGLELLIQAMAYVRKQVRLTFRGYGPLELELKYLTKSLNLEEVIFFANCVPSNEIIQSSVGFHVGLLPFERTSPFSISLPNKLFEYMAAGLAILANDLPEICSVVKKYDIGMIYQSEDPHLIALAIDTIAEDRPRLEMYRLNAWNAFNRYYTWKEHKKNLLDIYDCKELIV